MLVFKGASGNPFAIGYLPVTDITAGQPLDEKLHTSEMSLGMRTAVFGQDDDRASFDWSIDYIDGTHTYLPDQVHYTAFPLLEPTVEPTPTPTPSPTPVPIPRRNLFLPSIFRGR